MITKKTRIITTGFRIYGDHKDLIHIQIGMDNTYHQMKSTETMENKESMKDYERELEASFRTINEGDVIKGTVIDVTDEEVTLDLKYYTQGIVKVEDLSEDPNFSVLDDVKIGDVMEATVVLFWLGMSLSNIKKIRRKYR